MQQSAGPPKAHGNEPSASSLPSIFDDGDLYDLLLKDLPYGLDFYVALAREAQGAVGNLRRLRPPPPHPRDRRDDRKRLEE